jgi:hypothetical protein
MFIPDPAITLIQSFPSPFRSLQEIDLSKIDVLSYFPLAADRRIKRNTLRTTVEVGHLVATWNLRNRNTNLMEQRLIFAQLFEKFPYFNGFPCWLPFSKQPSNDSYSKPDYLSHIHLIYFLQIFNINFPSRSRSSKRHFPSGRRTHTSFLIMEFSSLPPSLFFSSACLPTLSAYVFLFCNIICFIFTRNNGKIFWFVF